KKENAIFLVTFFGQAKKRNAPAAAETALTASTKRKYKTENHPQQQIIIDNQNSLPLEGGGTNLFVTEGSRTAEKSTATQTQKR
ncbi:MAG: hypothetical protein R3Y27_08105, partial [Clostridia bacterium]